MLALLDRSSVVSTILWGNANRLTQAVLQEIDCGQHVWQTACVYGAFTKHLAERVSVSGRLQVIDVASLQVERCRQKLVRYPQVQVNLADASSFVGEKPFDTVCCFFLLHEVPEHYKCRIVDNVLRNVRIGGKAVFVDYHRPLHRHPLRGLMQRIFRRLEPFAEELWVRDIRSYATAPERYSWHKMTYFGELYQKIVVMRVPDEGGTKIAFRKITAV